VLAAAAILALTVALALDAAGAGPCASVPPAAAGIVLLVLAVIFPNWPRR
jgi:hypothetical protein